MTIEVKDKATDELIGKNIINLDEFKNKST